ncbi:hypothetical protein HPB50_026895 [Hyalomma asiaticum]|uniref:Uncharacterized protein n=1 Tax=Hyalomma asiaticum TaxID=266040 RepID=A0ACB7RXB4_HYAAI|nr:hypothetical protein HPB50_026895 [Hyalomma asiaticum]
MNRRNQYTAAFKKRAILLAEERGNSSAARHLGLTESTVRGLEKCRDRIFEAAPTRKAFRGPKTGRFPKIEEDLAESTVPHCSLMLAKRASVSNVARWINSAWEALSSAVVSWAFLKCCLSEQSERHGRRRSFCRQRQGLEQRERVIGHFPTAAKVNKALRVTAF